MKSILTKIICAALSLIIIAGIFASCGKTADSSEEIAKMQTSIEALEKDYGAINAKLDKLLSSAEETSGDETVSSKKTLDKEYAAECYEKIKYIDNVLSNRDCLKGENFKLAQKWITWKLMCAGYAEEEIVFEPFTFTKYYKASADLSTELSATKSYETDGKLYVKNGRNYTESETGDYVKVTITTENIVVTKKGASDKQIIVGAHYDGDGTGDNGSGIALALTTAEKLIDVDTAYTIVFIFFSAEEYGCYGSTAYANAMSDEEVAKTLYMINMDSLICGDYACLYGGVQDNANKTVTDTEAYDNAVKVAESLGIKFETNPWTWENPAPGYDVPDYASPSTGDWSDHLGFKKKGIKYLYFEATNWFIPGPYEEYDGYGETYLIGMLMNTPNDYLEYIEKYFPGRPMEHLYKFSALLNALVTQENIDF
ncbi:MAG: M28 family peptidase [Clostridia bacterium]|nr:M28 family peptidase [Clostridia bacterium]